MTLPAQGRGAGGSSAGRDPRRAQRQAWHTPSLSEHGDFRRITLG
jgi:hypothetical protein